MSGETILVVDDGQENRDFIVEYILKPNNFEALIARDGMEGLEMARQYHPDLILLDWQMPRMNGLQVIEALNAEQMEIPIVLMTFHGSEEFAVEVFRKGVRDYVKKPYTVEEMYGAIERSLTELRLRREKEQLTERLIERNASLKGRLRELGVLYNIGKSVTSLMEMDTLLPHIVEAAAQLTSADEGNIFLLDGDHLVCRAIRRESDGRTYPLSEVREDPLARRAIETKNLVVLTPEELAAMKQQNPSAPSAAMATPLIVAERPLGALVVQNVRSGARLFNSHDGGLLSTLADYAAIAVENASHYSALERRKEDEKDHIRATFERFVAPSVVDRVLGDESVELGGTRREISILYADLRGYSTFAEKAPPEQVVDLLNNYLGLAAEIVFDYEGMLDKFMGDAVMAVFNAPTHQEDHPMRAVKAALALQSAIAEQSLKFGIALHLGEAVVGYIGAAKAMNYTAIGDTINISQRIQEAAKPGQVLVTEAMARRVVQSVHLRQLGKLPLRGREQGILVFEILGFKKKK